MKPSTTKKYVISTDNASGSWYSTQHQHFSTMLTFAHQVCSCGLFLEDVEEAKKEYCTESFVRHVLSNPCRHNITIMNANQGKASLAPTYTSTSNIEVRVRTPILFFIVSQNPRADKCTRETVDTEHTDVLSVDQDQTVCQELMSSRFDDNHSEVGYPLRSQYPKIFENKLVIQFLVALTSRVPCKTPTLKAILPFQPFYNSANSPHVTISVQLNGQTQGSTAPASTTICMS